MSRQLYLTLAMACSLYVTVARAQTPSLSQASWFTEAGASTGNSLLGGLGVAVPVAANQEVFGELALQTGKQIGQASNLLIGVKSDMPTMTIKGRKLMPFTIVAYGASIETLLKTKIGTGSTPGLNAATITAIGTSAGFAQQYAAGAQTAVATPWGSVNIGVGFSGDKISSGWKGYPFVFLSHSFGKAAAKGPAKAGP
jgi:hypothetical protein